MKSMSSRQFATMAGMILLSFLLLGAAFTTLSYRYTIKDKQDMLNRNAQYIADFTSNQVTTYGRGDAWKSQGFQSYLTNVALVTDTHIMLATNEGTVVYGTGGQQELRGLEGLRLSNSLVDGITSGSYAGMTTLGSFYNEARYLVGLPIHDGTGFLQGLVLISCDASNLSGMWQDLSVLFLLTACAVILVAAIISSVTSVYQSRPVKEIAAAARNFGHGEFGVRVDVGARKDEIGELAEAFNSMADSLAKSEQRRSEFIANVSHELKTPMTTIAGFADGILDGTIPPERERDYLQIISSETRRLSRLVRSMLDLSRLQSDERLAQQSFDMNEALLRVLVSLEGKISAKKLEVAADLPEEPTMVWGDADSITQVCYNLLDNAIKFSPEGGTLGLGIITKGQKAYISVSNSGETIAPEEVPLIFDRFHKTDHSRSKDRDGVGLGLYIVKTILNSHKEDITCTSEDGLTKFTFTMTRA
ncbi:MAG: HAMP domain-containing sensor histidine kinase [Oscillospiraceae bacterium]|nr:HAMP domain-containing sensor histidine kinase [Oscillospiraceae bacterium]